jgi:hypothetical protein
MNRLQEIAGWVLDVLRDASEPLDEAVLHAQVNMHLGESAMLSEFADALRLLESNRMVTGLRNELRGPRWLITDKGRAQRHV